MVGFGYFRVEMVEKADVVEYADCDCYPDVERERFLV